MRIRPDQLINLLRQPTRWIDVRAPIEFNAGAVPHALNLPLLDDEERHQVGLTYKKKGQAAAIELGNRLVSGQVKEARIAKWLEAVQDSSSVIYCFRGGLRSQTVQTWLNERGANRPIVEGGYKVLRRIFLNVFTEILPKMRFQVVAGPTGSGKTEYLKSSGQPYLDLEGLACHRGSAFGAIEGLSQPSQAEFENRLAVELLKLSTLDQPVLIENESRMIGRVALPGALYGVIKDSPKLNLDVPFSERVENIFNDYVLNSALGRRGDPSKFEEFEHAIAAIARRLGGQRAHELQMDVRVAREEFSAGLGLGANRIWISKLLKWYYDPVYRA